MLDDEVYEKLVREGVKPLRWPQPPPRLSPRSYSGYVFWAAGDHR